MDARLLLAGLAGRRPCCGKGQLFTGFLKVDPVCEVCGADLGKAGGGEGPAMFIILIVGFAVGFAALVTELTYHPPVWVHLAVWLPLASVLCIGLMRPLKGLMVALQYTHGAAEAGRDDIRR